MKKIIMLLTEVAREHDASLAREGLKDLKLNGRKKSRQLNYRLSTIPYSKFISYIDYKFCDHELNMFEEDTKRSSITCPLCRYFVEGIEFLSRVRWCPPMWP